MARLRFLLPLVFALAACGGGRDVFQAYDSCNGPNDLCSDGRFDCEPSNLPGDASFTGAFCTVPCGSDSDCPLVVGNLPTICVNGQCFIQCADPSECPYGQDCFTFPESPSSDIALCTP